MQLILIVKGTISDRACQIAINPKYDGYRKGLASMVYTFSDKKIGSRANENEVLPQELHKPVF